MSAVTGPNPDIDLARSAVADRIRDLSHALMQFEQNHDDLASIEAQLAALVPVAQKGPAKRRELEAWAEDRHETHPPVHGEFFPPHYDRPVSGAANPWSIPLEVYRHGDQPTCTVTLRAAHEGAPERSHGGVVSAIFDDVCGYVLAMEQVMAFTAYLKVDYKAGTPIHEPITFSVWLDRQEGRKMFIRGECRRGETPGDGEILTTCDALFLRIDLPN